MAMTPAVPSPNKYATTIPTDIPTIVLVAHSVGKRSEDGIYKYMLDNKFNQCVYKV